MKKLNQHGLISGIVNIEDRVWKAGGVAELCYCSLSRDSYSARPVSKCKVST